MRLLMDYDWPGNVRELENLVKRTVVLGTEVPIRKEITNGMAARQSAAVHVVTPPAAHAAPTAYAGAVRSSNNVGQQTASHSGRNGSNGSAPGQLTPAEMAVAAAAAGNYSLKDISREAARQAERELILRMLQQTRWNRKETAEILGISYKALLYKIKENGLDKAS
jgi:two-component system response regulator AtoC